MMDFLIKHKLIKPFSAWVPKARPCLTNVLCFFEEITKWVDEGSPLDVIYLDFQKAFDKVPHQRLIIKLKSHGIGNCRVPTVGVSVARHNYKYILVEKHQRLLSNNRNSGTFQNRNARHGYGFDIKFLTFLPL